MQLLRAARCNNRAHSRRLVSKVSLGGGVDITCSPRAEDQSFQSPVEDDSSPEALGSLASCGWLQRPSLPRPKE